MRGFSTAVQQTSNPDWGRRGDHARIRLVVRAEFGQRMRGHGTEAPDEAQVGGAYGDSG